MIRMRSVLFSTSADSAKTTKPGGSTVPYYDVYPAARKTAESAVNKQTIPPGYKKAVVKYFNDIAPTTTR